MEEKTGILGEGTFGEVRVCSSNPNIAIKKIKQQSYKQFGVDGDILNEMCCLSLSKQNPFVVPLKQCNFNENYVEFHFDRYQQTLQTYKPTRIDKVMYQILLGLKKLEDIQILHRDIKPANILINSDDDVVIADLGLARWHATKRIVHDLPFTNPVVTLPYRSPELLLGANHYSSSIEIWSLGCILYELCTEKCLFPFWTEVDVIIAHYKLLGFPFKEKELHELPFFSSKFPKFEPLPQAFCHIQNERCQDLLTRMLVLNPLKRLNFSEALQHDYFSSIHSSSLVNKSNLVFHKPYSWWQQYTENTKSINNRQTIIMEMMDVMLQTSFPIHIFFVAATLFDHLVLRNNHEKEIQWSLIGKTCIFMISKILTNNPLSAFNFANRFQISRLSLLEMELIIIELSNYCLLHETCFHDLIYQMNDRVTNRHIALLFLCFLYKDTLADPNLLKHIITYCAEPIRNLLHPLHAFVNQNHSEQILKQMARMRCLKKRKGGYFITTSKAS